MFRLIGAVLVAGGCAAIGWQAAARLRERAAALSSLLGALELMESEIQYRLTPVPELMLLLSRQAAPPARALFEACRDRLGQRREESFDAIWSHSLTALPLLRRAEAETLLELGGVLGRYDVEGQERAIAYTRRRLESFLREAEEDRKRRGKVYRALGVAAGLCAAIILI